MPILPLQSPLPDGSFPRQPPRSAGGVPVIFKRLLRFNQMDFELAAWQLMYLCLAPKRVYRNVYFHKQTKNTWARDDPAILILIAGCLTAAAIAWSIAWRLTLASALKVAVLMITRDFLLVGVLLATLLWAFANRALLSPPSHTSTSDASVEWAYAFDVHTNAFFPCFLTLYVAQLFLLPILLKTNWVCLWIGNTLYHVAAAQYIYGLYLGFNALPFLIRTEFLLAPLLPTAVGYILSLLGFNFARHALQLYFGSL